MRKAIPYGRQNITAQDIAAVTAVLEADYLTQGPRIDEFEIAFAKYVGSNYAVAVANGTAALHLNAIALGVKPGSKVITTPITFAASANCIRYCGGEIVFSDIDPDTYLLDLKGVRQLLEDSPKGTYSGIIPVDFAGRATNMEAFRKLADQYDLWIIEDSCHSPGGSFIDSSGNRQRCGNGNFADLAIFSFHPVKHIAAGEGGMITTNSKDLRDRLLQLRSHGITRNTEVFENSYQTASGGVITDSYPQWYMEMQQLGYNYRLTDFQAALGLSQLKRAKAGLKRRQEIAEKYQFAFRDIKKIVDKNPEPVTSSGNNKDYHAYHLYVIESEKRLELYNHLRSKQIFAQIHYIPLHLMPYYQKRGWKKGDFPQAEKYYESCLSLPMYPTLTDEEQTFVINTILDFHSK